MDRRWEKSGLSSLIQVVRERFDTSTGKQSVQTDLYISNIPAGQGDCFTPIRQHWGVEVNNHIRDVTLKEDQLKTKKKAVTKVLAGLRTLVIKILNIMNPKNRIAQLDFFSGQF